jgi:hypothetical protein
MPQGWVINRRFRAQKWDPGRQRWVLESVDDTSHDSHVQIVFHAPQSPAIQGPVDVAVIRRISAEDAPGSFVIEGQEGPRPVLARSVNVHERPGSRYRAALPPQPVPAMQWLKWRLLLAGLRVPGVFAVVTRFRRRSAEHT